MMTILRIIHHSKMSNKEDRISRKENMPETFLLGADPGFFPMGVRSSSPLSVGGGGRDWGAASPKKI